MSRKSPRYFTQQAYDIFDDINPEQRGEEADIPVKQESLEMLDDVKTEEDTLDSVEEEEEDLKTEDDLLAMLS